MVVSNAGQLLDNGIARTAGGGSHRVDPAGTRAIGVSWK
jgi:hypothetical protein